MSRRPRNSQNSQGGTGAQGGPGASQSQQDQGPQGPEGENCSAEVLGLVQALSNPDVLKAFDKMLDPKFQENRVNVEKAINEALTPISERLDAIELDNENKFSQVTEKILKLEDSHKELVSKLNVLDRDSRSNNLRIYGVPLKREGDEPLMESYINSILSVMSEADIQEITASDFSSVTKITPSGQQSFLLAKMTSESSKKKIYSQRTKLKNLVARIYINEDLTKVDMSVHRKARKQVKEGILHSCWTLGGQVFAKTSPEGKPFPVKDI